MVGCCILLFDQPDMILNHYIGWPISSTFTARMRWL